jgi:penicillin-insensitive murein DD-endopeptidase
VKAALALVLALLLPLVVLGCARAPSPLSPLVGGSIGSANRGRLTDAAGLRHDDHHHGLPRFVTAIERAAATVARSRPGAVLSVGDISAAGGGTLMPHLSHRSGRDADLLLYLTTLDGAPVESPGFVHVGPDGLAWDDKGKRFLRFDVEREWLLVKTLVEDPEARVQWIFANHVVEAMLVDWARARGEPPETIVRAMDVMLEPHPGGPHDDHVHVRTDCAPADVAAGCERTGPRRPWIDAADGQPSSTPDGELVLAIVRPLAPPVLAAAASTPAAK